MSCTNLPRRTALTGLLGLLGTAACTAADPAAPPTSSPTPTPTTPSPTVTVTPTPTPPPAPAFLLQDVAGYTVLPGEVEPGCKQAAVDFVTAVLTAGTPGSVVALADRLSFLGQDLEPALALADHLPADGASVLEIVYPQYGGLTEDDSSVMLVARQRFVPGGGDLVEQVRELTLDVRLNNGSVDGRGDGWYVTEVRPASDPVAVTPSSAVQDLLDEPRVILPAAARGDLLGGGVADVVAVALLDLARTWQVHVQVLTGGHPFNVWDTDRMSNHTRGRAVDVWALDGIPVIDHDASPWAEFVRAGSRAGASEVGSPWTVGVRGGFTDHVHQDHIHLGFGRG